MYVHTYTLCYTGHFKSHIAPANHILKSHVHSKIDTTAHAYSDNVQATFS